MGQLEAAAALPLPLAPAVVRRGEANAFALPGRPHLCLPGPDRKCRDRRTSLPACWRTRSGMSPTATATASVLEGAGLSFLFGMLLGDFVGGGAVIFAAKTILQTSYSREVETAADGYGVALDAQDRRRPARAWHHADRGSPGPRIPDRSCCSTIPIRRAASPPSMRWPARTPTRPLLDPAEWAALKRICSAKPE